MCRLNLGLAELWTFAGRPFLRGLYGLVTPAPCGLSSLPFLFILIVMGFTILGPWWAIDGYINDNQFPWVARGGIILGCLAIFRLLSLLSASTVPFS